MFAFRVQISCCFIQPWRSHHLCILFLSSSNLNFQVFYVHNWEYKKVSPHNPIYVTILSMYQQYQRSNSLKHSLSLRPVLSTVLAIAAVCRPITSPSYMAILGLDAEAVF